MILNLDENITRPHYNIHSVMLSFDFHHSELQVEFPNGFGTRND